MSQVTTEAVKKMVEERKKEFNPPCDFSKNRRTQAGVALEITVRLLAPELYEQVLAVVQGRA
jgi:hypothetical protein